MCISNFFATRNLRLGIPGYLTRSSRVTKSIVQVDIFKTVDVQKWIFPENNVQFQKVVSQNLATQNYMTEKDIDELIKNLINARGRECCAMVNKCNKLSQITRNLSEERTVLKVKSCTNGNLLKHQNGNTEENIANLWY